MVEKNIDLAKVLLIEIRQSDQFMHGHMGTKLKDYLNIIADIIQEGQKSGEIKEELRPTVIKQLLFGAIV